MLDRVANQGLRRAMESAGVSNKSLARAIQIASAQRGRPVRTDHTRVAGWLRGAVPRRETAQLVAEVLSVRLGSTVTLEDLGFGRVEEVRSNVGLTYDASLTAAVATLAELTRHDAAGHPDIVSGDYSSDALNALCLDWLFGESRHDLAPAGHQPRSVDVRELKTMTATFDTLDRAFSGEHHRQLAVAYLHTTVVPKLSHAQDNEVGREFLRATAVLCELIGWMAYDTLRHSIAQRYFAQAVRFAQGAGDEAYAAYAVSSMADQALFVGRAQHALRLANVARSRTAQQLPSLAMIEAYVFEARAHALLGDLRASEVALGKATDSFHRLQPSDFAGWGTSWSPVVLASHAGTCWVDLGKPDRATPEIETVWSSVADEQPRRRVYSAVQLSRIAHLRGEVEQAAHFSELALDAIPEMGSLRSIEHLDRQIKRLAATHPRHPSVLELTERMANFRGE